MPMKSIVFVTRNLCGGGTERVLTQLASDFAARRLRCTIITMDAAKIDYPLDQAVAVLSIGRLSRCRVVDALRRCCTLRALVKRQQPDVVLAMPEEVGICVLPALLGCGIPVYVSERNNPWTMPRQPLLRWMRRLVYPLAKGIICQTEEARMFFPRAVRKKCVVLANPVDAGRIPPCYTGAREKVIVGAGRLSPEKDFPLLIRSFSLFAEKHPDFRLCIYGEGPQRPALEALITQLGLQAVAGLPGRSDALLRAINPAAMFVLSSAEEGMPNVLLEALCMGMPVIATDCPPGAPRQLIEHGINGLLVPVHDAHAMAAAMESLCDPALSAQLARNAGCLRERLTSRQVYDAWAEYLLSGKLHHL